jgi:hypothetical protein
VSPSIISPIRNFASNKDAMTLSEEKDRLNEELEKAVGESPGLISSLFRDWCIDQADLVSSCKVQENIYKKLAFLVGSRDR